MPTPFSKKAAPTLGALLDSQAEESVTLIEDAEVLIDAATRTIGVAQATIVTEGRKAGAVRKAVEVLEAGGVFS